MSPGRTRKKLVDLRGEFSNRCEDIFKELEDWEAILKSLPDVNVGNSETHPEPPDPSP